jgi:hypothetical protein
VLDLEQELDGVLRALEQHDIAYAICGGIAMAIHGHPRGETLMLDLLLVTPKHEPVWQSRETWPWRGRSVSVVSAGGLIALKSSRGSKQDLADIERLNER